jgi:hypothetical protein
METMALFLPKGALVVPAKLVSARISERVQEQVDARDPPVTPPKVMQLGLQLHDFVSGRRGVGQSTLDVNIDGQVHRVVIRHDLTEVSCTTSNDESVEVILPGSEVAAFLADNRTSLRPEKTLRRMRSYITWQVPVSFWDEEDLVSRVLWQNAEILCKIANKVGLAAIRGGAGKRVCRVGARLPPSPSA